MRTRVKERAEEQSSAMSDEQQAAIRIVANDLHRLNQAVMKAVEAGVSVELVRSARHHGGNGNWGDLLIPVIVTPISGRLTADTIQWLREETGDSVAAMGRAGSPPFRWSGPGAGILDHYRRRHRAIRPAPTAIPSAPV